MDNYWSQPPKAFTFIKIIAGLLILVVVVALVLVFTLKIHETVKCSTGQVLSRHTPIVYHNSVDAKVKKVLVEEGQAVKAGDTLLILENETLWSDYQKASENQQLAQENITLLEKQLKNLGKKVKALKKQGRVIDSGFENQNYSHSVELRSMVEQINNLKKGIEMTRSRLDKDRKLLQQGLMSHQAFQEKQQHFLAKKNQLTDLEKQYYLRQSSKEGLSHSHSEQKNEWKLRLLTSDYDYVSLEKQLLAEKNSQKALEKDLEKLSTELRQLTIVADIDGHVSDLFNRYQSSRFLPKGTTLLTLSHLEEETFYAKIPVPQESISKVNTGQEVHLKLDAYNHYYYGILKAKVEHIVRQDTSHHFFVLADIEKEQQGFDLKSGYQLKGDIVVKETRLFRFIWEKLLRKSSI